MERFIYKYKTEDFDVDLEKLLPEDALLFDIETTGLSREWCSIYLIGCGYRRGDEVTVELIFAPTPEDEEDTLRGFFEMLQNFSHVITFNGESFDIPFIRDRAKKYDMDCSAINNIRSLDLYKLTKKYKKYLNTPDCRQKTIEQYYGLFREDKYNGGQLIDIYKEYCKRPDPNALETVLLHNHEDVKGMLTVLNILELDMLSRKASFAKKINDDAKPLTLSRRDTSKNDELLFGFDLATHQDILISDMYYSIAIRDKGITAILHPYIGELKHFYSNYRDYCYIPDEDLLIPKALASTIDKSRLQKVTKENCCAKHEGIFIPISDEKGHQFFDAADTITYKKSCSDKQLFIEIKPEEMSDEFATEYITALIQHIL